MKARAEAIPLKNPASSSITEDVRELDREMKAWRE